MASPLSLLIGLRFSRGRRRSGMVSSDFSYFHVRYRIGCGGSDRGFECDERF